MVRTVTEEQSVDRPLYRRQVGKIFGRYVYADRVGYVTLEGPRVGCVLAVEYGSELIDRVARGAFGDVGLTKLENVDCRGRTNPHRTLLIANLVELERLAAVVILDARPEMKKARMIGKNLVGLARQNG